MQNIRLWKAEIRREKEKAAKQKEAAHYKN